MRAMLPLLILCLVPGCREETAQACEAIRFDEQPFTVCRFAADDPGLALFRTHPDGAPFADFSRLAETISADGGQLVFAMNAGITLHVECFYGDNNHHVAESAFKAVARALRDAVEIDPRAADRVPSTKGTL